MAQTFCVWCHTPIKVRDPFDDTKQVAVCSRGCKIAEMLFMTHFSDEAITQRAHYRYLTEGDDECG